MPSICVGVLFQESVPAGVLCSVAVAASEASPYVCPRSAAGGRERDLVLAAVEAS